MGSRHFENMKILLCSQILLTILCLMANTAPISDGFDSDQFLLVRVKRNANRAMTYSGFNPNGGMTALATSADFSPSSYYYQYGLSSDLLPPPPKSFYKKSSSAISPPESLSTVNNEPANPSFVPDKDATQSEENKPAIRPESNPAEGPSSSEPVPNANEYNPTVVPPPSPKKGKKKPVITDEEDDDETPLGKSSSRSSSSFNAWFPIMLSMYPSSGGIPPSAAGASFKEAEGQNGKERSYGGTTIIANSVSNGKSGVAHAIAYGGS